MCVCGGGGGGGAEISELAVQLRLPAESIITNPALLLDLKLYTVVCPARWKPAAPFSDPT